MIALRTELRLTSLTILESSAIQGISAWASQFARLVSHRPNRQMVAQAMGFVLIRLPALLSSSVYHGRGPHLAPAPATPKGIITTPSACLTGAPPTLMAARNMSWRTAANGVGMALPDEGAKQRSVSSVGQADKA